MTFGEMFGHYWRLGRYHKAAIDKAQSARAVPMKRVVVREDPRLARDGDGDWDYWCPKCQPPAIVGQGRACAHRAPTIHYREANGREWFAATCGVCGYHDEDPGSEPVYDWVPDDAR